MINLVNCELYNPITIITDGVERWSEPVRCTHNSVVFAQKPTPLQTGGRTTDCGLEVKAMEVWQLSKGFKSVEAVCLMSITSLKLLWVGGTLHSGERVGTILIIFE